MKFMKLNTHKLKINILFTVTYNFNININWGKPKLAPLEIITVNFNDHLLAQGIENLV